jgi:hypothetical protein
MTLRTIIKVGRGGDCQFQLNSPNVSSQHAWVVVRNNSILLIDCGTTNGTRLKSQGLKKITQTVVSVTDTIYFADQEVPVRELLSLQTSDSRAQNIEPALAGDNAHISDRATNRALISHRPFFSKLMHGDYGLAKTYWLFGVLGSTVLGAILALAGGLAEEFSLALIIVALSYSAVVLIGTWRAASRYLGPKHWAVLAKLATALGWGQLAVAGFALAGLVG